MNIVIDENISSGREAFSEFGNIKLMHGRSIIPGSLSHADVLIVRSITKVNEKLLQNTPVKFVGTATIGTDHIDLEYLKSKNIAFAGAKGCNADAVAEYVFTSILFNSVSRSLALKDKSIGIIGIGNIGSRIEKLAKATGLNIILNDPPLKRLTGNSCFRELDDVLEADIITMHVPLNRDGIDKTVHLFDETKLNKLKDGVVFINASRGQVVDNEALNRLIEKKKLIVTLDVWENEPDINIDLLDKVELGTPHIAGYSLEGKINGTMMIYNALCKFLNVTPSWKPVMPLIENNQITKQENGSIEDKLFKIFSSVYNIASDDEAMRKIKSVNAVERPQYFDQLRKNYPLRREFINYMIKEVTEKSLFDILKAFRFKVE